MVDAKNVGVRVCVCVSVWGNNIVVVVVVVVYEVVVVAIAVVVVVLDGGVVACCSRCRCRRRRCFSDIAIVPRRQNQFSIAEGATLPS